MTVRMDYWLLSAAAMLLGIGILMVATASMVISEKHFGTPLHYFWHQFVFMLVSVGVAVVVYHISTEYLRTFSGYLLLVSAILLVLVLVPGIGHSVNGSRRWLMVGPISFQVSELAKFSTVVFLAGYLVRRGEEVRTQISGFIKPMIILSVLSVLLLLEPDFGATAVIMATALGMMFLAGVRLTQFAFLFVGVALALGGLIIVAPYRLERLLGFLHPWANQFDSGYQLTQSLIAFGRGGVFGVGLGNSIQKLFYLPEAHTDFLFAVLTEELGLLGAVTVIGLFVVLVGRALFIGVQAVKKQAYFQAYLAYGFGLWLGLQALINIGVNTGVLPTKGLTLPFMSYGSSSMLINCIVVAVLLRISNEVADES